MSSPFPGMDPYLEHPELWPEVHNRLIVAIADAIAPPIRPKYRVAIEKRTYWSDTDDNVLVGIPDVAVTSKRSKTSQIPATVAVASRREPITAIVPMPEEVREGYLEIREVATGKVVTVLEVLSPKNKRSGKGRSAYESKRQEVLGSVTHLVEIDLLRGGKSMPILGEVPATNYRILVSRGNRRPIAQLYAFSVREEIPSFPLPLNSGDAEPEVELQALLAGVYERAGFDLAVDYSGAPVPPLKGEDAVWALALLREQGLR